MDWRAEKQHIHEVVRSGGDLDHFLHNSIKESNYILNSAKYSNFALYGKPPLTFFGVLISFVFKEMNTGHTKYCLKKLIRSNKWKYNPICEQYNVHKLTFSILFRWQFLHRLIYRFDVISI